MPTTKSSQLLSTVLPEIEQSDVEAVRKFLIAHRDEEGQARPMGLVAEAKGPTFRNGIPRARMRSAIKSAS